MLTKDIVDHYRKKCCTCCCYCLHQSYLSPRSTHMARVNMYGTLCNLVQAAPYQCCLHVLKGLLAAEKENNPPQRKHAFYMRHKKWTVRFFMHMTNLEMYNSGVGFLNVGSGRKGLHSSNFTMSIKNDLLTHLCHSFPSIFH